MVNKVFGWHGGIQEIQIKVLHPALFFNLKFSTEIYINHLFFLQYNMAEREVLINGTKVKVNVPESMLSELDAGA